MQKRNGMNIVACGSKHYGPSDLDGGSWWFLLDYASVKNWSKEDILNELGMYQYYRGPGRFFTNRPYVVRRGHRVYVFQSWGYDV